MNMYDMCLCASVECPRYHECCRGGLTKRQGIYTSSFLAEICNESSNYEYYIPDDTNNKEEQ